MSDSIKIVSSHAECLADGQLVGPGETAEADLGDPVNKRLVAEGKAVVLEAQKSKEEDE